MVKQEEVHMVWEMLLERFGKNNNINLFAGDRKTWTNKYHTGSVQTIEKDVSNRHFEIAEGKETGRDLNQTIRGMESLKGKNAKDEISMSKILSL